MLKTILFLLFYLLLTPYNLPALADLEDKECYLLLYLGDVVGAECATLEVFFFCALSSPLCLYHPRRPAAWRNGSVSSLLR